MAETFIKVEDDFGNRYTLTGKSWEGGQGKVIVDSTGRFVIKLLEHHDNPVITERIRKQIRNVRLMPLSDLPVAKPISILKPPAVGYVMEYLTGMEPLTALIDPPLDVPRENSDKLIGWYIKTGGLKRRLDLLARLATVLNRLHSKGLAYGDLSPNNVFVSSSLEHTEVYLIDLDNLCYESSSSESFIHTKFFAAPEVFTHVHGIDTLSDAFSLAVIVFETLALGHPLMGDMVVYGDPDLELSAQEGKLPWIFHSSDNTNLSNNVLPKELVFSEGLFKLLRSTFEDGLVNRKARPGAGQWEKGLHAAARFTITCPTCKWSYFHRSQNCPWCGNRHPDYLLAAVDDYVLNSEQTLERLKPNISGCCMEVPGKYIVSRRLLGFNDDEADMRLIELEIDSNFLIQARCLQDNTYWIVHEDWKYEYGADNGRPKERLTAGKKTIRWHDRIHIGELDKTHQVIRFERK